MTAGTKETALPAELANKDVRDLTNEDYARLPADMQRACIDQTAYLRALDAKTAERMTVAEHGKYPCYGKTDDGVVVRFTDAEEGEQIAGPVGKYDCGSWSSLWDRNKFIVCDHEGWQ